MTVFDRLISDSEGEEKIAVHPFYSSLMLFSKSLLTQDQMKALHNLTDADFLTGTTIDKLLVAERDVTDSTRGRQLLRDFWSMATMVEYDRNNVTGLRDETDFFRTLDFLVGQYNA